MSGVWSQRRGSGPLVVDIDSTLVEVHSPNKAGAAPYFKGGYGGGFNRSSQHFVMEVWRRPVEWWVLGLASVSVAGCELGCGDGIALGVEGGHGVL